MKRVLLWVVTADRGLCGAFSMNLIRLGRDVLAREKAAGHEVTLWASGRKGVAAFRFRQVPMARTLTGMTDRPAVPDAQRMAKELVAPFLSGEVDRVLIVWPRFESLCRQPRR